MGNCIGLTTPAPETPTKLRPPYSSTSTITTTAVHPTSATCAPPVSAPLISHVLKIPIANIIDDYELGPELGRGQYGITRLATNRTTGEKFACKSIPHRRLTTASAQIAVRREVQIMRHVAGHRNVVELHRVYEDHRAVHILMELCEGGELFDRIIERGHYSERAAAKVFRDVAAVVYACHSKGVFHRDLKPENFLFLSRDEESPLKATDFGLSTFFAPGEMFSEVVGSVYYVAPEVLQRNYGPEADMWSAGVILYILLSGVPPFWAETDEGVFQAILYGNIDFSCDPWPSISNAAKDLLEKMLRRNPKERPSAAEVLRHPWIMGYKNISNNPIAITVLNRMKRFRAMNKLKKVALKVIAENLSEEEIAGLSEIFKRMDTDSNGIITFEELKAGLVSLGSKLCEAEIRKLMEAADVDGNGNIDYVEFISATMNRNRIEREDLLHKAFEYFDKDRSGYITVEDLEQTLKQYNISDTKITKDIVAEVDADHDGKINYDEFVAMMKKGNAETLPLGQTAIG